MAESPNRKLDPALQAVLGSSESELKDLQDSGHYEMYDTTQGSRLGVIVHHDPEIDPETLRSAGLDDPVAITPGCTTGHVLRDNLIPLAGCEGIRMIGASRSVEPELNLAAKDIGATQLRVLGHVGNGTLVGIFDVDFDFRHPNFLSTITTDRSRALYVWDMGAPSGGAFSPPAGYSYGAEYTKLDLDRALRGEVTLDLPQVVQGHGTHVTGIAAGNGQAESDTFPANTYVGIASETQLLIVVNRGGMFTKRVLDGFKYMIDRSISLQRPLAINLSAGLGLGPHDGTSVLERGIDLLLETNDQGVSIFKSAGNNANKRWHAPARVAPGASATLPLQVQNQQDVIEFELWYPATGRLKIQLVDPDGKNTDWVGPHGSDAFELGDNRVAVVATLDRPENHDNSIYFSLRGDRGISPGQWRVLLDAEAVGGVIEAEAWLSVVPRAAGSGFSATIASSTMTITEPGNAQNIITVGAYSTRAVGIGQITNFSSRGPTRDGRTKPDFAAPGYQVFAANSSYQDPALPAGQAPYIQKSGTSMAAPMATGTAAIVYGLHPTYGFEEMKWVLTQTARQDDFTGTDLPDNTWGAGKLDAFEAVLSGEQPPLDAGDAAAARDPEAQELALARRPDLAVRLSAQRLTGGQVNQEDVVRAREELDQEASTSGAAGKVLVDAD